MKKPTQLSRRQLVAAIGSLPFAPSAFAQGEANYPERPIRLIVPNVAGGGADAFARQVANKASQILGRPIVVENRAGAGSTIGAEEASRAAPDGYTLLWGSTTTFAIAPHVYPSVRYDPRTSFEPISAVMSAPLMLVVSEKLPVKDVASLIALAKAQPGKLNYGSAGAATTHHIAMELFRQKVGLDLVHVPYKGEAPAVPDLLAGNIDLMFASINIAALYHASGRLKILGSSGRTRSVLLPDVPTIQEQGFSDYNYEVWQAVVAPKGTPNGVLSKLNSAFVQAITSKEVTAWIRGNSAASIIAGPSSALKELIAADYERYREVVKNANIAKN